MHLNPLILLTTAISLVSAAALPANDLTKRDGSAVVAAVAKISDQTEALNSTVSSYDGGILGTLTALKIETEAIGLNNALRSAISTTKHSANFTDAESLSVATAFLNLVPVVQSTLDNIVSKKPDFDTGLLGIASISFLVKDNLETEQQLSLKLGQEVEKKLTAVYAAIAPLVLDEIDGAFTAAIDAYS